MTPELEDSFRSNAEVQTTPAIAEIRAAASVLLERLQWMRQAGISFEGARDLYEILGYPRIIGNRQYRDRYARGGLAKRIVDAFPKATWRGGCEVVEDEDPKVSTEFEKANILLDKKFQIWPTLQRADILSGLSTYSVILLGAAGSLKDELPKGNGSPEKLLYLTPFCGGGGPNLSMTNQQSMIMDADCAIKEYDLDPGSKRYGLPKIYQLRRLSIASQDYGLDVHWTRIIHIAEGCLDDEVFGVPALEAVWNLLDDLDKITGGGAEAFWLRANQGFHINFDKDMKAPDQPQIDAIKENLQLFKHGIDRWIRTRGTEINPLGSDVANFSNPADAVITQIAGTKSIPKRILTGSEMGELASSQDRDNWKDQINGRQTNYAGPFMVRRLWDRLIKYQYVPTPKKGPAEYLVQWPHIQVLTDQEKAAGALSWGQTQTAEGPVFNRDEIRDHWYGMEPIPKPDVSAEGDHTSPETGLPLAPKIDPTTGLPIKPPAPPPVSAIDPLTGLPRVDSKGNPIIVDPKSGLPIVQQESDSKGGKSTAIFNKASDAKAKVDPKTGKPVAKKPFIRAAELHDYSTVQVNVGFDTARRVKEFAASIPNDELAVDGREDVPHITIKYGLHTDSPETVAALMKDEPPATYELGKTNFFPSDEYDVLFIEVYSDCLERLNKLITDELATTTTYPVYVPHLTVAYLKPGLGMKYAGMLAFNGQEWTAKSVTFNDRDGNVTVIPLGGTVEDVSRAAEDVFPFITVDNELTSEDVLTSDSDLELLQVLEEAIKANNTEVIDRIIGIRHGEEAGHEFHGNQYTGDGGRPPAKDQWEGREPTIGERVAVVAGTWRGRRGTVKQLLSDDQVQVVMEARQGNNTLRAHTVIFHKYDLAPGASQRVQVVNAEDAGHEFHGNQWTGGTGIKAELNKPSSAYPRMHHQGRDTQAMYSDGHGHYTPERQALHDAIIAHFMQGTTPVEHPQALILGGGMGAGKTTLVAAEKLAHDNTVENNVDKIRDMLPEYLESKAAAGAQGKPVGVEIAHEEASDISRELLRASMENHRNMTLDGTGDTTLEKLGGKVAEMRAAGHTINAEYVTLPTKMAQERADRRAETTDRRFVPPTSMTMVHAAVSRIYPEAIRQGLFDHARLWDTSGPRGSKPTLISSAVGKEITVHDQGKWNEFLAKSGEDQTPEFLERLAKYNAEKNK